MRTTLIFNILNVFENIVESGVFQVIQFHSIIN